jgi:1-acyl-sn-glycerol-3-phosphate acyltransferase
MGRATIGTATKLVAPLRVYGAERMPRTGGLVVAANHFSWIDPPVLGMASPRTLYFMAKVEAHRMPGLGQLARSFGAFPVRRGESDRDAVRTMREIVRSGHALGMFVEDAAEERGPRIRTASRDGRDHGGCPRDPGGHLEPELATRELRASLRRLGRAYDLRGFHAAVVATGSVLEIERKIRELWEWLVEMHRLGRPRDATPPA